MPRAWEAVLVPLAIRAEGLGRFNNGILNPATTGRRNKERLVLALVLQRKDRRLESEHRRCRAVVAAAAD